MVNYLTRLTGNRDRAEDLAQETFLRLFRSAGGYTEQGLLRAYLYRIATNLVRSEERRERRLRLLAPFLLRRPRMPSPRRPPACCAQELHREVAAAVAALPLRCRVPLVLHEIEGWSYADIAAQLGCREGTVKSRIHRGRQQLKARLEPYWNGGRHGRPQARALLCASCRASGPGTGFTARVLARLDDPPTPGDGRRSPGPRPRRPPRPRWLGSPPACSGPAGRAGGARGRPRRGACSRSCGASTTRSSRRCDALRSRRWSTSAATSEVDLVVDLLACPPRREVRQIRN